MPPRPVTSPDLAAVTPFATLDQVLGYGVASASVATLRVFADHVGEPFQVRPVEFTILKLIQETPGVAPARLAQVLAVTAPSITMWIDQLNKRGWVERRQSQTDRRAQELYATPEGQKMAADATERLVIAERKAFAGLTRGEQAILLELLHKLAGTSFHDKA